jgi:hypothetical protein
MPDPRRFQRASTRVFSVLLVVLGAAIVISTLARGGGVLAARLILGVLFVAAGAARLYLLERRAP